VRDVVGLVLPDAPDVRDLLLHILEEWYQYQVQCQKVNIRDQV
jgi:hypothetical protein